MIQKATYSISEAAEILGISAPSMYKMVKEFDNFPILRVGKRILVPKAAFENWLENPRNYKNGEN